jgi:hypothetical protein
MLSESLGLHSLVLDSFTHTPSYLLVTCISAAFLSLRFIHNFNLVHYLRQHSLGELILSVTFQTLILTTYICATVAWLSFGFRIIVSTPELHVHDTSLFIHELQPRLMTTRLAKRTSSS